MKLKQLPVVLCLLVFAGCQSTAPKSQTMAPLEIQSMQTRAYSEGKDVVFPAVVSVFQDLGYNVKSADIASGFINAESPAETRTVWFSGRHVGKTVATAFVENVGARTRVRLNFVFTEHVFMGMGSEKQKDEPVLDAQIYSNAFERIDNAVFIRKQ